MYEAGKMEFKLSKKPIANLLNYLDSTGLKESYILRLVDIHGLPDLIDYLEENAPETMKQYKEELIQELLFLELPEEKLD